MARKTFKNILITGASSGLGEALALHYAASGVFLALGGRDGGRLAAVAQACRAKGAAVEEKIADVTDAAALRSWIEEIDGGHPLDLVIANAGVSGGTGGQVIKEESPAQVRKIFDINLTGVLNTIEPVQSRMAARGSGQIGIMSSLASFSGWPGAPAYSASKAAVRVYGEALRGMLAGRGVGVTVLCPGFIRTPMTAVNNYPMPFMMNADKAARIMAAGLAGNRARVAFPWPTYLLSGFFGLLPPGISASFFSRLPEKPASGD